MTSDTASVDKLEVLYDSRPVAQSYLATFTLASCGRADIARESFSGNKPLLFDMGVPVLAHVGGSSKPHQEVTIQIDETKLAIEPTLIPKSFYLRSTFLLYGAPEPHAFHRLTDIPILSAKALREKYQPLQAKVNKTMKRLAILAATVLFAAGMGVQMFPALGNLTTRGSEADRILTQVFFGCFAFIGLAGTAALVLTAAITLRLRPLSAVARDEDQKPADTLPVGRPQAALNARMTGRGIAGSIQLLD